MLKSKDNFYAVLISATLCVIILLCSAIVFDLNILEHNVYDSYTRQALAWREGRTYLNDNPESIKYLELAIYEGKYYVSFPPVPSIIEYFLTFIFGNNTPNQLMLYIYTLISCIALTVLFYKKYNLFLSVILGLLASLGTNIISLVAFGGVWHEAQCLSFMLCSLAVLFIKSDKKILNGISLFCASLAVGCRPFTVIFIPFLLYELYKKNISNSSEKNIKEKIIYFKFFIPYLIAPALVAFSLMFYNVIRFDNPFEFGHNYLPEFTSVEEGQFNLSYLIPNLKQAFKLPFEFEPEFKLNINKFSANIFYIFNPIIAVFFYYNIKAIIKNLKTYDLMWLFAVITFIFATCMHRTLGGFQFGARYFIDLIPYLALYIMGKNINKWGIIVLTFICIFAVSLNIYGAFSLMK
ncbi:MAG: hypothetical protein E7365_00645 [Clostridiales bacterium]|nr:hypothetical protein [Clostridiales bacterium]